MAEVDYDAMLEVTARHYGAALGAEIERSRPIHEWLRSNRKPPTRWQRIKRRLSKLVPHWGPCDCG